MRIAIEQTSSQLLLWTRYSAMAFTSTFARLASLVLAFGSLQALGFTQSANNNVCVATFESMP